MNETDGVASHSFCIKYLSIICTFRPSNWRSAIGNLRFFDPEVAAFCGDKRRADKVTVAQMGPATRYTLLRITASIIKV